MKKTTFRITGLLFLLIAIAGLAACGSSTETVTLEGDQFGADQKVTLEAEDDQVQTVAVEMVMPYSTLGLESKEEAESMDDMLQSEYADANDTEGIDVEIAYEEEELTISVNIDFTTANSEDLNDFGFGFSEDSLEDEDLSLEEAVSDLEEAGFEVVEE